MNLTRLLRPRLRLVRDRAKRARENELVTIGINQICVVSVRKRPPEKSVDGVQPVKTLDVPLELTDCYRGMIYLEVYR